jgi:hypothetical protein
MHNGLRAETTMNGATTLGKPAPARMHQFIGELMMEIALHGKVISIEVADENYLVTLELPRRGVSVHFLSAWDMSRSLRGDPEARASISADLLRGAAAHA